MEYAMRDDTELKPCPLCGSAPKIAIHCEGMERADECRITCKCGLSLSTFSYTPHEVWKAKMEGKELPKKIRADELWNHRVDTDR